MQIRIEGTRAEVKAAENILQHGLNNSFFELKQISRFYPDEQKGIESKGRVYLEIEKKTV